MKTISAFRFPLSAFLFLSICGSIFGTPLLFSLQSLTGVANNRTILVQPDRTQNPLVLGTNLVPLRDFTLQPVNGQVITNLLPWGYTIRVDGWPRSAHINVPTGTNLLNVVTLINTNAFSPITIQMLGDNATGTNVNLSGTFTFPKMPTGLGKFFGTQTDGDDAPPLFRQIQAGDLPDLLTVDTLADHYNNIFYKATGGFVGAWDSGEGTFAYSIPDRWLFGYGQVPTLDWANRKLIGSWTATNFNIGGWTGIVTNLGLGVTNRLYVTNGIIFKKTP